MTSPAKPAYSALSEFDIQSKPFNCLKEIHSTIATNEYNCQLHVNMTMIRTFWKISHILSEIHSDNALDTIHAVLEQHYGEAFSHDNFQYIRKFHEIPALGCHMSWDHYKCLLNIPDNATRITMLWNTIQNQWSLTDLQKKLDS